MSLRTRQITLLETFLETLEMDLVCGFFLDPEVYSDGPLFVYAILSDKILSLENPQSISRGIRAKLKKQIEDFLNFEVDIGTTVKNCDKIEPQTEPLTESIPLRFRRRLTPENLNQYIETALTFEFDFCQHSFDANHFMERVVNAATDEFLLWDESFSESDDYDSIHKIVSEYFTEFFGKGLIKLFIKECGDNN